MYEFDWKAIQIFNLNKAIRIPEKNYAFEKKTSAKNIETFVWSSMKAQT